MSIAFFITAIVLLLSAVGVVAYRNPLYSALCLVLNLFTVAVIFALLEAHFLATVQIIVYAGAIMVLVIFVLMLLNLKTETPRNQRWIFFSSASLLAVAFLAVLIPALSSVFSIFPEHAKPTVGSVEQMGRLLYTEYVFPFEAASFLIMAAIVGAVMIAKRQRREAVKQ